MRELYDKVIEAYKAGDDNLFELAARRWVETDQNPFPTDTSEHQLYFKACKYYRISKSGAINCRSAKRNMYQCVKQIAEMDLKNPYEQIKPKKERKVIVEPAEHVFGVIPTQKIEIVKSNEVLPPETDIEEIEDTGKKKKRHFFKKEGSENDSE